MAHLLGRVITPHRMFWSDYSAARLKGSISFHYADGFIQGLASEYPGGGERRGSTNRLGGFGAG